ncbi:MAG: hypothetical protein ACJA0G_000530 [Kangiellaceae bacterium]|jgi:hypothetical protein
MKKALVFSSAHNGDKPSQQQAGKYAGKFIAAKATDPQILFGKSMNPKTLAFWVKDSVAKPYIFCQQPSNGGF